MRKSEKSFKMKKIDLFSGGCTTELIRCRMNAAFQCLTERRIHAADRSVSKFVVRPFAPPARMILFRAGKPLNLEPHD
jgi:hypothetical protein